MSERPDPSEWEALRRDIGNLVDRHIELSVRETLADGDDPGDQGVVTSWILVWNQMVIVNDGRQFNQQVDWTSPPHQPAALDVGMLIQAADDIRHEAHCHHEDD